MSGATTTTSLSFRPWKLDKSEATALKNVLARVNQERGHFRDITEASLQEEIAAQGGLESSSSEDEDEEHDGEATKLVQRKPPTTREELFTARQEMKTQISAAHQDILLALDFVSLLESKHALSQAAVSMSPALKKDFGIPAGSLGTDIWDQRGIHIDKGRKEQDGLLASKVRMESLQQSADDLMAAAANFQDNVRKETVFWEQVLSISKRGWNVSKLYKHLLGVHIGFSDKPQNSAKSVAALFSDGDGNIALERGIGTRPRVVRAIVRKEGSVVGCSKIPALLGSDETALDARIRQARDSVYDEELFYEMVQETRNLTSMGVSMRGSSIGFDAGIGVSLRLEFDLVPLDEDQSRSISSLHELDILAEAALLTVRLLLCQEHRRRIHHKRTIPAPLNDNTETGVHNALILRPVVLLVRHHIEVSALNTYLENMSKLVRATKAPAESRLAQIELGTSENKSVTAASLIGSLLRPILSEGMLWLTAADNTKLEFRLQIETSVSNSAGSKFRLSTPSGLKPEFYSMEDLLEASDEFVGLALCEHLRPSLGAGWELDDREGILKKSSDQDPENCLWFLVDSTKKTIMLHGGQRGKEVMWTLNSTSETRSIGDVWREVLT